MTTSRLYKNMKDVPRMSSAP